MPLTHDNDRLKRIGMWIRINRERLKLSQEVFAAKVGIDRSYVSGIENGKRNITVLKLLDIAQLLGIGPEVLLR